MKSTRSPWVELHIGRVVECLCNGVTDSGAMRHGLYDEMFTAWNATLGWREFGA